jgi:KaiC/GvpD/RAD55 family RecA-like ATPase
MNLSAGVPIVETGKGFHVYYRHPGGEVRNGVRVGRVDDVVIDIRGDGGYVVAPPSIHESGRNYQWLQEGELSLLPEMFRRGAVPAGSVSAVSVSDLVRAYSERDRLLAGVGPGERNHAAAKIAGYFIATCKTPDAAWAAVQLWNKQNDPPLDDRELRQTYDSISRRHAVTGSSVQPGAVEPDVSGGDVSLPASGGQSRLKLFRGTDLADHVRHRQMRVGVPCPSWPGLEEVGGVVPKDLLILAARPGTGKTATSIGVIGDFAIRQKQPTIFFSTEMTASDVASWLASFRFGIDQRLVSPDQWEQMLAWLSRSPLTICDAGSVNVLEILEIVRSMPETKLVIIDHIQRLQWGENRNTAIEAGAAMLKSLAKDNDCTVMALSQLNRSSAYDKRRPQLHDLRDSGGLEQEADAVCFLWSDAEDVTAVDLPVKFWWAKNRHGALAEKEATFHKAIKRFVPAGDLARLAQTQMRANHDSKLIALAAGEVA